MTWLDMVNTILLGIAFGFTFLLYRYARQREEAIRGGEYLSFYLVLSLVAQGGMLMLRALDFPVFQFVARLPLIGVTLMMPVVWYRFVVFYTGHVTDMQRRQWHLLLLPPLLAACIAGVGYGLLEVGPRFGLDVARLRDVLELARQTQDDPSQSNAVRLWAGILAFFMVSLALYQAFLLVTSARLLLGQRRRVARLYQRPFMALTLLGGIPWLLGLTRYWSQTPDPNPLALPIGWLGVSAYAWWVFSRYDALVAMPVVMDTLFPSLSDALLVLDTRFILLEANPAAVRFVEALGYRPPRVEPVVLGELFTARERARHRLERPAPDTAARTSGAPLKLRDLIGQPCRRLFKAWPEALALLESLPGAESMTGWTPDPQQGPVLQRSELCAGDTWYDVRLSPLFNGEQLAGWLMMCTDITRRRQAELAAEQARAAAEAANRAKSAFLANMSHELRTPLNAILGFTELLTHDPALTPHQREQLDIIARSGEHLLDLINDVLDLSKIEAGRMTIVEEPFDLPRLLRDLEDMFRLRASAKGLALLFELDSSLVPYVLADAGKLRQILINLLSNAVKFTQQGGVTLRARCDALDDVRQLLVIEVEDTGPGIAPEELPAVFEPFVQTRAGQRQQGTGLGMPISRQLSRLMGGDLTVTSTVGVGTCFRLSVPLRPAPAEAVAPVHAERHPVGLKPGQPTYRILVVDDVPSTCTLLLKLLQPLGFEVRSAEQGQAAIEIWQTWQPHLIFMDMRMPVMDGREATRRIRALPGGDAVKIVALTASAFEEERAEIMAAGCDDFVRKPFRAAVIWEVLERQLGVAFEEAAPEVTAPLPSLEEHVTPAALAHLPSAWRDAFHKAALSADADTLYALLQELRDADLPLRHRLQALVDEFRFDVLAELSV